MRESDIMHESGAYWVGRTHKPDSYTVYIAGAVASTPDSSYAMTPDGLSIAIARAQYLAMRHSCGGRIVGVDTDGMGNLYHCSKCGSDEV